MIQLARPERVAFQGAAQQRQIRGNIAQGHADFAKWRASLMQKQTAAGNLIRLALHRNGGHGAHGWPACISRQEPILRAQLQRQMPYIGGGNRVRQGQRKVAGLCQRPDQFAFERAEVDKTVHPDTQWLDIARSRADDGGARRQTVLADRIVHGPPDLLEGFAMRGQLAHGREFIGYGAGILEQGDGFENRQGHAFGFGDLGEFRQLQSADGVTDDHPQQSLGCRFQTRGAFGGKSTQRDDSGWRKHDAIASQFMLEMADQRRSRDYDSGGLPDFGFPSQ